MFFLIVWKTCKKLSGNHLKISGKQQIGGNWWKIKPSQLRKSTGGPCPYLRPALQWSSQSHPVVNLLSSHDADDVEDDNHKDDEVLHLGVDHIEDGLDEIALSLV